MKSQNNIMGYKFRDPSLFVRALTHTSYAHEQKNKTESNERLEFLGDSVLEFIVTEYLYLTFPGMPEGEMSRLRAETVREEALAGYAEPLKIGDMLRMGRGETSSNGNRRPSTLADAFEAVLGAIYLDGGMDSVKSAVMPIIKENVEKMEANGEFRDYKTSLQEMLQRDRGGSPAYRLKSETGPAHQRSFIVEATLNGDIIGEGEGSSKKDAEQAAAKDAIGRMGLSADGKAPR